MDETTRRAVLLLALPQRCRTGREPDTSTDHIAFRVVRDVELSYKLV
jgi:hypothetical protein